MRYDCEMTTDSENDTYATVILGRLAKSPHLLLPVFFAWMRGWGYRIKYFLTWQNFSAGKLFRVYGPMNITGPGQVRFGDNVLIISNAIKPVCIRTLTRVAKVVLGNNTGLNGTSIQCAVGVSIDDWSNIADAYITDTPAHTLDRNRRSQTIEDVQNMPVSIGKNVWVSVNTVILHGVHIGDNSVIGACTLVRKDIPSDVFAAGNPLRIIKKIDQ